MKKILAFLMAATVVFGMTSCNKIKLSIGDESSKEESSVSSEAEESSSEEEASSEESSEEASSEESAAESKSADTNADVKDAIEASKTSDTNPAKLGQWVKTSRYSATDSTYHTVYARVVKVKTESDDADYVKKAIEENNKLDSYYEIDKDELKIPSDCELGIMEYEVYVPSDFPTQDWGITTPDISFSVSNIGGGGIPSADGASTYIGLSSLTSLRTEESEKIDGKYQVGGTYTFRELYVMVKGYKDYVFSSYTYPEGTKETANAESFYEYHSAF